MSLRWSQRVLKTLMGGPVCRPYVLKRFPHGGRPQGSPLRRIQKLSLRFVGAGHWPARRCTRRAEVVAPYSPAPVSTCSAKPGAAVGPHQL